MVSVITSLAYILGEMYQTEHSAISLESLYPAIDSMASYLCDGLQHDSHELLVREYERFSSTVFSITRYGRGIKPRLFDGKPYEE